MHMSDKDLIYTYNGIDYPVIITRKRMKSIRYTFKDGVFHISAPYFFASKKEIFKGLDKFADKLIAGDKRGRAAGDDFIYILGEKKELLESGEIPIFDGRVIIIYKNKDELDKKLRKWFLSLLTERTHYYETIMNIQKPYKIRLRKMSSRYGSNSSQTHSITYSTVLLHYSLDIIDSVVVHELAHHFVRDHSKRFYNVVYTYCPNYNNLHKRLRKGEF